VQIIDARDLAEWTIRMVENGETGIYNATGPNKPLGMGEMLDGIKGALKSNATFTWANAEFLEQQKVAPCPTCRCGFRRRAKWAGWVARASPRAIAKGLTFRPLEVTARDTLAYFKSLPEDRQAQLKAGLKPNARRSAWKAWHRPREAGVA
jgi:2'-hydroxyisoflavone reductase